MEFLKFLLGLVEIAAREADEMDLEDIHKFEVWSLDKVAPNYHERLMIVLYDDYGEWYVYFVRIGDKWLTEMSIPLAAYELA